MILIVIVHTDVLSTNP